MIVLRSSMQGEDILSIPMPSVIGLHFSNAKHSSVYTLVNLETIL